MSIIDQLNLPAADWPDPDHRPAPIYDGVVAELGDPRMCCTEAGTCPSCADWVCQDHPDPVHGEAVMCDHHETLIHVDCHRACEPYADCMGEES